MGSLKTKIKEGVERITRERPIEEELGAGEWMVLHHLNHSFGKKLKRLKGELPNIRDLRGILRRLEKRGLVSHQSSRWLTTEKGERLKKRNAGNRVSRLSIFIFLKKVSMCRSSGQFLFSECGL